jgi:hypothetical protein
MGARSKEELEWVAEQVEEAGGEATLWVGRPSSRADEARIVRSLRAAMAERYRGFLREVEEVGHLDGADRRRGVERLRRELRRLAQRDHFPPPEAARARRELERLAERTGART